jgi:hypothetical protein
LLQLGEEDELQAESTRRAATPAAAILSRFMP